jgi:anti-sigma factor (TIGR02949 family)
MDCKTALSLLDVYLDGELDRTEARALEAHLDACPDCAAALARADALRRSLREPALRHTAPQELRDRIRAAAEALPSGVDASKVTAMPLRPRRASPRGWAIAAGLLIAFTSGGLVTQQWLADRGTTDEKSLLARDLFASHWRALAATSPVDVVSSDHHTVKPWFAGKLADSPPVQDFAAQGFTLVGGRIDYVGSQRVAVLAYRHGAHLIDVYVLPQDAAGSLPAHSESRGYSADAVSLGSQQAAIVTDMDAKETARFAALLRETR